MNDDEPRGPIPTDANAPFTKEEGWHWAWAAFKALFSFCPNPSDLARERVLTRRAWLAIASWLAPIELFVRRLLLLEALALPAQNAPAPGKAARPNVKISCGRAGFASENSSDWGVAFRMIAPIVRVRSKTHRTRINPIRALSPQFMTSQRLAERIEALARVFDRKAAYARRLARRLARASADVVRRVIGKPGPPRGSDPIGAPLDKLSHGACLEAAKRCLDSS